MKLGLSEIIKVTGARLLKGDYNDNFYGFSTDTRTIKADEIYIPLKGENFDGENFIEGELVNVTDDEVSIVKTIKTRKKTINIVRATIDKARLAIKF